MASTVSGNSSPLHPRQTAALKPYRERLIEVSRRLRAHFGHQHWWPADARLEMCVGAVLTQNTAWSNVEKALDNLKKARRLNVKALHQMPMKELAALIRPAGYFNVKAKRLKALVAFLEKEGGAGLRRLEPWPTGTLREKLLSVHGVGKETADSILLYGFSRPLFVIDAYTRRISHRLGLTPGQAAYDELQEFLMRHIAPDVPLYNDFHAQFVALGKHFCKPRPLCAACPLSAICPREGVSPKESE